MLAPTTPSRSAFVHCLLTTVLATGAVMAQVTGPRTGGGGDKPKPQEPQAQPAQPQQPQQQPSPPQSPSATDRFDYTPVHSRYLRLEAFDRYGRRERWNPLTMSDGTGEYPILRGAGLLDVYNTNLWKGDEPILGEHTFFAAEAIWNNLFESRDKVQDSSAQEIRSTLFVTGDFFHGDTVFRPPTWRVRSTLALDIRDADDVDAGNAQGDASIQELFGELLLWETDPYLDFGSVRLGRQAFASDFRSFIFQDNNDGIQLFGTLAESSIDWQIAFFDLVAKDPFSNLNRGFESRDQQFWAVNVFFEDLVAMGYEVELTLQGVSDDAGFEFGGTQFDRKVDAYYLGFNGEGRIGKLEVAHALYWMTGEDDNNLLTGNEEDINAQLAALEITLPWDWRRYVFSVLYASGDGDSFDGKGEGFDSVFDNPAFAGGAFGFFHRQAIAIAGQTIVNANSFYPNLRTKAFEGPNSVNPGLIVVHGGCEATLSNQWAVAANAAYLSFADPQVLEDLFAQSVSNGIGFDFSLAANYRPLGVDNCIVTPGIQLLIPTGGFKDLSDEDALFAFFVNAVIVL